MVSSKLNEPELEDIKLIKRLRLNCGIRFIATHFILLPWILRYLPSQDPDELPMDRGTRHEIDLVPGTKYCVTSQWPLSKEQVEAIGKFFVMWRKAGHIQESKSPHCSPTFCVKKTTGGWRIVHAFNKLNDATNSCLNTNSSERYDPERNVWQHGVYRNRFDGWVLSISNGGSDIPLTAVSTPSGMLWEMVSYTTSSKKMLLTHWQDCYKYLSANPWLCTDFFDHIFVHSKASDTQSDLRNHLGHLRKVFKTMREVCQSKKCISGAPEIPVLGCFVGVNGVKLTRRRL